MAQFNIEALHPDEFILDLLDLAPGVILKVLDEQTLALSKPPMDMPDVLETLESNGLVRSMVEVRRLMGICCI